MTLLAHDCCNSTHGALENSNQSALDLKRLVQLPRSLAATQGATSAQMVVGHVLVHPDDSLWMDVDGGLWPVQVADSCLWQVQSGDWVCAVLANQTAWVMSVLQQQPPHNSAIRHLNLGDAELHISAKKICMTAQQHIDIQAPQLSQIAGNRQSTVHGTDSTRVSNSVLYADSHLSLHAKSAMVTAESLLKVDAAQIHMG
jgi:Protein of unknown function (DUF3540)